MSGAGLEGLDDLCRSHRIRLLVQFGSTVRGGTHARSDVDLGVLLERSHLSLAEHAELLHELQRLFPGREVDLAILNTADPLFLRKIAERCRLLHGPARLFHEFRIRAYKRYQDHRRFLALEREYVARVLPRASWR
jgi:predicted nucleotidyltransferase